MHNARLAIHKLYETLLREQYGPAVFETRVPYAADFKEAIAQRKPIAQYKPKGASAKAIKALADELLARLADAPCIDDDAGGRVMGKLDELMKASRGIASESMGRPQAAAAMHRASAPAAAPMPDRLQGIARSKNAAEIPLDKIDRDPDQPREEFDPEALARLAESLRARGQLQPIRVRWDEARSLYVIVCGERRWRAARMAGLPTMSCVIMDGPISPAELLSLQLVENLVREDLKPIEQAKAFRAVMDLNGWSTHDVARELAVDQSSVVRALALLDLPAAVQEQVEQGTLLAGDRLRGLQARGPRRAGRTRGPGRRRGPQPRRDRRGGAPCIGAARQGEGQGGTQADDPRVPPGGGLHRHGRERPRPRPGPDAGRPGRGDRPPGCRIRGTGRLNPRGITGAGRVAEGRLASRGRIEQDGCQGGNRGPIPETGGATPCPRPQRLDRQPHPRPRWTRRHSTGSPSTSTSEIIEAGALEDPGRVELIDGYMVDKMGKKAEHRYATMQTIKALDRAAAGRLDIATGAAGADPRLRRAGTGRVDRPGHRRRLRAPDPHRRGRGAAGRGLRHDAEARTEARSSRPTPGARSPSTGSSTWSTARSRCIRGPGRTVTGLARSSHPASKCR